MLGDEETQHPLYGKDTKCHQCSGVAVWVLNGHAVGNYHYCRQCKVETGPFAKTPAPELVEAQYFMLNGEKHYFFTQYLQPFDFCWDEET